MAKLDLNVQQVYLDAIAAGTKTAEGRLAKEKYRALKAGDVITFHNNEQTQSLDKAVVALRIYATFEAAFKEMDFKDAVPNARNIDEAIAIYEQFYSKKMQQQEGIVFIVLR